MWKWFADISIWWWTRFDGLTAGTIIIIAHVTHFTDSMPMSSMGGGLGWLGGGGGVKHEAIQHCGGVIWSV